MHPLLRRPLQIVLYALGCAVLGALLALGLAVLEARPLGESRALAVPLAVLYGFVCLSAWWVCRAHPLGGGRALSALRGQLAAAVQATAVGVAAATGWGLALGLWSGVGVTRADLVRDAGVVAAIGVPAYLVSSVVHYLLLAFEASHAAERRALEAQVSAREAELRALRAQLNPHFLFNSLNSISALAGSDPEGARRMCEGLGDFMRTTLDLGGRPAVPLGEELALVDRYLDIERVRFGERLRVERAVEPAAVGCAVPPLLLQPLVENAVKHGVAGRLAGGVVRIEARIDDGRLLVAVENPVDEDAPATRGIGHGLENVRRRLDALGGGDTRLSAVRQVDRYRVELSLPATAAPAASARRAQGGDRG